MTWIIIVSLVLLLAIVTVVLVEYFTHRNNPSTQSPPAGMSKGEWGENTVANILLSNARPDDRICNDLILFNTETGKTSQVDHIFICKSGIYVIETKTYSGKIYGTETEREWTEVLTYHRKKRRSRSLFKHKTYLYHTKNKFYSPIKQNNTHLYTVRKIVGEKIPIRGFVVFVSGDIRNVVSDKVLDLRGLDMLLHRQTADILSPDQIQSIYNKLLLNRDTYRVTQSEHIHNIHKMQYEVENNICPRCGRQLVLRSGKFGQFYGCSGYPACKFKKKP